MQRDLFLEQQQTVVIPAFSRLGSPSHEEIRDEFWYDEDSRHGSAMDASDYVPMGSHVGYRHERRSLEVFVVSHVKVRR